MPSKIILIHIFLHLSLRGFSQKFFLEKDYFISVQPSVTLISLKKFEEPNPDEIFKRLIRPSDLASPNPNLHMSEDRINRLGYYRFNGYGLSIDKGKRMYVKKSFSVNAIIQHNLFWHNSYTTKEIRTRLNELRKEYVDSLYFIYNWMVNEWDTMVVSIHSFNYALTPSIGCTYNLYKKIYLSCVGGINFLQVLRVDKKDDKATLVQRENSINWFSGHRLSFSTEYSFCEECKWDKRFLISYAITNRMDYVQAGLSYSSKKTLYLKKKI